MKKIIPLLFIAILLVQFIPQESANAETPNAFETSKMIFNQKFIAEKHIDKVISSRKVNPKDHFGLNGNFKSALDIMFLSTLEYQAERKNDPIAPTVLNELEKLVREVYLDLFVDGQDVKYWESNAYVSPTLGLLTQSLLMVDHYNKPRFAINSTKTRVDIMLNGQGDGRGFMYWLNNTYLTKGNSNLKNNYYYQDVRGLASLPVSADGYAKGTFSINIPALHAGALALDAQFKRERGVTENPFRDRIVEIGQYLKYLNYGPSSYKLSKVGGNRIENGVHEGDMASAGYTSWAAMSLAMIAHGTTTTGSLSEKPDSMFITEAKLMQEGFKETYRRTNPQSIPTYFYGFGTSPVGGDAREYLYSMAWTGDQSFITWLDDINIVKHGSGSSPVILRVANSSEQNFHRALSGLTAGMHKNIHFK
ncbi:hypothetical protein [Bacillus infantis]|uniref:hypothetical protein n=1 Tax=Bacillus infantis TaxID=324767 RepID=UPI003CEBAEF2